MTILVPGHGPVLRPRTDGSTRARWGWCSVRLPVFAFFQAVPNSDARNSLSQTACLRSVSFLFFFWKNTNFFFLIAPRGHGTRRPRGFHRGGERRVRVRVRRRGRSQALRPPRRVLPGAVERLRLRRRRGVHGHVPSGG